MVLCQIKGLPRNSQPIPGILRCLLKLVAHCDQHFLKESQLEQSLVV